MANIKHILVVLDPQNEAQPALTRAAYIARATGAHLHLFLCAYDTAIGIANFLSGKQQSTIVQTVIDGSEVKVERLAQPLTEQGLLVTHEVVWDRHHVDAILGQCDKQPFDLIVKHAQRQSRADGMFTHLDWNLMRYSPCPTLLVKDGQWDEVGQVLAAVDGIAETGLHKRLNNTILESSRFLAHALDFELHIVSAYPSPPVFAPVSSAVQHQVNYRSKMRQMVENNLMELAGEYGIAPEHVHAVEGPVDWVVPNLSEEMIAEFVVLGNVSRVGKAGLSLGSMAESTLDRLNTNVLMVQIGETDDKGLSS